MFTIPSQRRRRTSSSFGPHTAEEAVANLSQSNSPPNPFSDVQLVRSPLNSPDDIHVLVGTWNVATRTPTEEDMRHFDLLPWLAAPVVDCSLLNLAASDSSDAIPIGSPNSDHSEEAADRLSAAGRTIAPDIVVLGFQELVTQPSAVLLPRENFVYGAAKIAVKQDAKELGGLEPWIDLATEALNRAYGGKLTSTSSSQHPTSKSAPDASETQTLDDTQSEDLIHYEPLCLQRMVALGIIVFIRDGPGARIKVSGIRSGSIGTGLLGVYGNKGSVSLALDISLIDDPTDTDPSSATATQSLLSSRPVSLCFVNAHLGPHEGESYHAWRNDEIASIFDTLVLYPKGIRQRGGGKNANAPRLAGDHDALWFLGDTNYRLRGAGRWNTNAKWGVVKKLKRSDVYDFINKGDVKTLLSLDELTYLRETLHLPAFKGFVEAPIDFLPSYKHHIYHFGELDSPEAKKEGGGKGALHTRKAQEKHSGKRFPAYCDRILVRASDIDDADSDWNEAKHSTIQAVQCLSYRCIQEMGWSDHKPVVGLFNVSYRLLESRNHDRALGGQGGGAGEVMRRAVRRRFRRVVRYAVLPVLVAVLVGVLVGWVVVRGRRGRWRGVEGDLVGGVGWW
ncbi:hypothetical protein HDV00_009410 [Rhizophlyctis rosea]|nr:hypothetical protein HDV00_009410 [Rhizophlyctis rosea]